MTAPLKSARAVADVTAGNVLAIVEIAVPPERVFRALTDPEELTQWWGSPELYRVTDAKVDLRIGGQWSTAGRGADGSTFTVSGEYLEIDPPRRLVHTWKPDWEGGASSTVRYLLEPIDGGTRVTVRHDGFGDRAASCQGHADGWERVLGWLVKHFPAPAPTARKYFFCRLIAPRPTFALDMTPDEAAVMKVHGAYLRTLLARGNAIVFGPVLDPAGPWGLAVFAADDEEAVRALQAEDPAIKSGRGFRYENLPMLTAVH
jgi:uncharacterized protein YndB with AHSA1/START domain/uncharacterized protein YciI